MRVNPPAAVLILALACAPLPAPAADATTLRAEQIQTLVEQADALIQQNQYEPALELLQTAYARAGSPADASVARNVLNSLANLHYSTGDLAAASRYRVVRARYREPVHDIVGSVNEIPLAVRS